MTDLTTLERVKALLDIPSDDTVHDAAIGQLVSAVSVRVEKYLNRPLLTAERTEYLHVKRGQCEYQLAAFPVTSIASVKNSSTFDWAGATAATAGTDYTHDPATGILYQLAAWIAGPRALQVVYTAGMGADTTALVAAYPDLADAVEKQVAEEWRRRGGLLRSSTSVNGQSETSAAVTLLPIVEEILAPLRRPVW